MKKLFSIGVLTLVMLTSCQNSNDEITSKPEAKTFSSKTTAKGEELPKLTPEQEREMIEDAIANVKESRQNELDGKVSSDRYPSTILCHSNYNQPTGQACVWNNGYLVSVTWEPEFIYGPGGNSGYYNYENIIFTGQTTSHCSC